MKLLWLLLLALAVIWLIKGLRRPADRSVRMPGPDERPRAAPPAVPQIMLRCAHCGMHLPSGEAIQADGRPYCSIAHRDAGPRVSARD